MMRLLPPGASRGAAWFLLALAALTVSVPLWSRALGFDPFELSRAAPYLGPSLEHWLGTDDLGRDFFSRLFYAAQVSLTVSVLATIFTVGFGALVGLHAGYHGGWADRLLMRGTDALRSLPRLPLMILFLAVDLEKLGLPSGGLSQMGKLVVIVSIFGWGSAARLARASALSLRDREFVVAARALGLPTWRVVVRHVLPNAVAPLLVTATLMIGEVILYESVLSYLGLGVEPPTPSWGAMLRNGLSYVYEAPMLMLAPGVLTFLTVSAFHLVGEGLRDALDPRLRTG